MSPTLTTFLFEVANFLLLAGALGWLFFKPVRQALADHRAKFEADNLQAAESLAEAERLRQEISAARENLQAELNEQRSRELEAAHLQADRNFWRTHAPQLIANCSRASVKRRGCRTLSGIGWRKSPRRRRRKRWGGCWNKSVVRNCNPHLIQSACRQLEAFPQEAIAPVKFESNQPLSAADMAMLKAALGPAGDSADFRTVDDLGGRCPDLDRQRVDRCFRQRPIAIRSPIAGQRNAAPCEQSRFYAK